MTTYEVDPVNKALRLPPKSLTIVGFGFARNRTDDPWFRLRDLNEALYGTSARHLIAPSRSGYSEALTDMEAEGVVDTKLAARGEPGRRGRLARVTPDGEDVLLENVVYSVTHRGLTVPELLHIPKAVNAVLYKSDFPARLFNAVSGQ